MSYTTKNLSDKLFSLQWTQGHRFLKDQHQGTVSLWLCPNFFQRYIIFFIMSCFRSFYFQMIPSGTPSLFSRSPRPWRTRKVLTLGRAVGELTSLWELQLFPNLLGPDTEPSLQREHFAVALVTSWLRTTSPSQKSSNSWSQCNHSQDVPLGPCGLWSTQPQWVWMEVRQSAIACLCVNRQASRNQVALPGITMDDSDEWDLGTTLEKIL